MSYSFDYFVSAMKCSNCGRVSPADSSTGMQTYLRDDPQLENLGVGSVVGTAFHEMDDKRYLEISTPGAEVVLLDTWNCPYCGHPNWARIVIKNGVITDIHAVELNRETVKVANYVLYDALWLVHDGDKPKPVTRENALETLLRDLG
jgi:hypothetical protein